MSAATLNRHGLAAPTVTELRTSMMRAAQTDFDAFWARACADAKVPTPAELQPEQLKKLCDTLIQQGGLVAVLARGFHVRVSTFAVLSAK